MICTMMSTSEAPKARASASSLVDHGNAVRRTISDQAAKDRRGESPRDFVVNLASGLCLMLALHAALTPVDGRWIMGFVAVAGAVHGVDLWLRWRHAERKLRS